jgi:hypothetical protein
MYFMISNDSFISHDNLKNDGLIALLVNNSLLIMFPIFIVLLVIKF